VLGHIISPQAYYSRSAEDKLNMLVGQAFPASGSYEPYRRGKSSGVDQDGDHR
jgi:hypothetical protein